MSSEPRIVRRRARRDEAQQLAAIETACFSTDRIGAAEFQALIDEPGHIVLVADYGDQLVGLVVIRLPHGSDRSAYIYSLAVLPNHQGRCVGKRLLRAAAILATRSEALGLRLEVSVLNFRAQAFYGLSGFERFARLSEWYEDGTAAYEMWRSLGPDSVGRSLLLGGPATRELALYQGMRWPGIGIPA